MTKKLSASAKKKPALPLKFVRIYFTLEIDYVFPDKPKTDKLSGKAYVESEKFWINECCESLASILEEKLPDVYDGVAFKNYKRHADALNLFTITFSVSILRAFNEKEILTKGSSVGFSIKARPLSLSIKEIRSQLYTSLCYDYKISDLELKLITSREFAFEMYFEGEMVVEYEFSDVEIRNNGGVSNALNFFFDEIDGALIPYGYTLIAPTKKRRSPDNRYVFGIVLTEVLCCGENDITGPVLLADREMSLDDLQQVGLCNPDSGPGSGLPFDTESFEMNVQIALEGLNNFENVQLVSCNIGYVDQDDDVCDCTETLSQADSHPSGRTSNFLDRPDAKGEKSKVFILFDSTQRFKSIDDAIDYLNTEAPIPVLLLEREMEENLCVKVECLGTPKIVFGFSPPSGTPSNDLREIMDWFDKSTITAKLVSSVSD